MLHQNFKDSRKASRQTCLLVSGNVIEIKFLIPHNFNHRKYSWEGNKCFKTTLKKVSKKVTGF